MRTRRVIITVLVAILCLMALAEFVLSVTDPLGMIYFPEIQALWSHSEAIPAGWAQRPGEYRFRGWTATILKDHTRLVPGTPASAPETWLFLGDSVTFGYGVSDADTFPARIAALHPEIRVVNAATAGYNSANVRLRAEDFPSADRLIYLVINNDAEPTRLFAPAERIIATHEAVQRPWISIYADGLVYFYQARQAAPGAAGDIARFREDVSALCADPRVLMIVFEGDPLAAVAGEACAVTIPMYSYTISWTDAHPNAASHAQIAESINALLE